MRWRPCSQRMCATVSERPPRYAPRVYPQLSLATPSHKGLFTRHTRNLQCALREYTGGRPALPRAPLLASWASSKQLLLGVFSCVPHNSPAGQAKRVHVYILHVRNRSPERDREVGGCQRKSRMESRLSDSSSSVLASSLGSCLALGALQPLLAVP